MSNKKSKGRNKERSQKQQVSDQRVADSGGCFYVVDACGCRVVDPCGCYSSQCCC